MPDVSPAAATVAVARKTPLWIWGLLAVSVVLMGTGLVMPLLAPEPPPPAAAGSDLVRGFAAGSETAPAAQPSPWAPAVFRLGFSFFIGFAIASALKFAFRFAMVAIGFFVLALFGLQYAGLVEVKWGQISAEYDSAAGWLSTQFASFQSFVTGYLPSAAAAGAGMLAGFLRG